MSNAGLTSCGYCTGYAQAGCTCVPARAPLLPAERGAAWAYAAKLAEVPEVDEAPAALVADGTSPRRYTPGARQRVLLRMRQGQWIIVPHAEADTYVARARKLGGRAISYRVSETDACVKLIHAPWATVPAATPPRRSRPQE